MKFAEQERKKKLLWGNKSKSIDGATGVGGAVASIGGTSLYGSLTSTEHPAVAAAVNSNVPAGGMAGKPGLLGTASGVAGGGGGGQASLWASTRFANDKDGKMAEKFRRLMGVKDSGGGSESGGGGGGGVGGGGVGWRRWWWRRGEGEGRWWNTKHQLHVILFRQLEQRRGPPPEAGDHVFLPFHGKAVRNGQAGYHTHKGFGLGFTSQSFMPK
ncbi:PE-PGRS family protein PE_PGRS3-like [Macrobrachium nipponense]|uniref:PE-PGRS family protein PE_PGRS3-like n=1 Tax=Macrobrachium nipponense TaxID=159736 RepID=UPI0030C8BB2A